MTTSIEKKIKQVLNLLLHGKKITSIEAFNMFGATRLSSIIFTLKKKGYKIKSTTKFGDDKRLHWAEYRLEK